MKIQLQMLLSKVFHCVKSKCVSGRVDFSNNCKIMTTVRIFLRISPPTRHFSALFSQNYSTFHSFTYRPPFLQTPVLQCVLLELPFKRHCVWWLLSSLLDISQQVSTVYWKVTTYLIFFSKLSFGFEYSFGFSELLWDKVKLIMCLIKLPYQCDSS